VGSFAARTVLTVAGAAAMILGAFLQWVGVEGGARGTELHVRVLWTTEVPDRAGLFTSVGFVVIVLGVLALIGLALRTGWLTRLAGALGLLAFILSVVTLYRVTGETFGYFGIGAWLVLAGSILAIAGGFMGRRPVVEREVTGAPAR
jgi:hypothetical protein